MWSAMVVARRVTKPHKGEQAKALVDECREGLRLFAEVA